MPAAGTVIEVNAALEANPELVNSDPYGEGWMVKVKIDNPDDIEKLMAAEDYEKLVA